MTIKRLVAAMLLAGLSNSVLAEQSFTVQDIQVEGLQRVALGADYAAGGAVAAQAPGRDVDGADVDR